jgi:hypothetical protein
MIELYGTVWTETMLQNLIEDVARQRTHLDDLRLRVTQQAAEVVRIKIELSGRNERVKQLTAETQALRQLSAIDRKRAQEAVSSERSWHGQAVQFRYELEALKESLKKSAP